MQDAIAGVHSAEITRACATPNSTVSSCSRTKRWHRRRQLVAAADDLQAAFAGVLTEFARVDAEYVTVLTALNGSGVTREALEELCAHAVPDAEVHFHEGGQPLYPILASASDRPADAAEHRLRARFHL